MTQIQDPISDPKISRHSLPELVAGVTMISFSAIFVKLATVGPTMAAFYRMFFGALLLILVARFVKTRLWNGWQPLLLGLLCGLIFAGDLSFWHRSIHAVGPGLATVLANFQVFFLAAFGMIALRERPGARGIIAIPLAMIGLFMIVGPKWQDVDSEYKLGLLFGIITAMFYASYVLVLRKLQSRHDSPDPMANITISSIGTAITTGIIALIQGESFAISDTQSLLALIAYGLCGQVLGWVLITRSIKHIPASRVGLILLLQPTLAFIWDILFFGRSASIMEITGAVIALFAIYLGSPRQAA